MTAPLKVKIRRSDGKTEEVTVADAILIYERRRDAAVDENEKLHCESRIEQLRTKYKKTLGGKVARAEGEAATRLKRK